MSTLPLVLLALTDDPVAPGLRAALSLETGRMRIQLAQTPAEVVEACATETVALLVMSSRVDDTAGARLLREIGAFGSVPQTVVLFQDAGDPKRTLVAQAGGLDHVVPPALELQPLLALIERAVARQGLAVRLDEAGRQFTALVDNSNDGIYVLKDGYLQYTNRRFQQMFGYTAEELLVDNFEIADRIAAPNSRAQLTERQRRIRAGLPVESRYEFTALRKNGETFDAHVSISYLDADGGNAHDPAGRSALGIMQDITERKRFEEQIVRKNRELALLNELSTSISQADALPETLARGCRQLHALLGAAASGICLVDRAQRALELRAHVELDDPVMRALAEVSLDGHSLLAETVRSGKVAIVEDLAMDPRVALDVVRASRFRSCIVVPLHARTVVAGPNGESAVADGVLGAAFAFLSGGRKPNERDVELLVSIGTVLGNAAEKAALLDLERSSNQKLVALDEIAMAVASTLDPAEVAARVARSIHRSMRATRVLIARLSPDEEFLLPLHVLDDGEETTIPPIPRASSIMGEALTQNQPVQQLRPMHRSGPVGLNPQTGDVSPTHPFEQDMFNQGVGAAIAVPVLENGVPTAALWIGLAEPAALPRHDVSMLQSTAMHVAIAFQNAALFASRERALEGLTTAQAKLVESEKLNAIGLIAHGVAHDFNNVLGSILARAQILQTQVHDPALLKHAEIIVKAAGDGAETVRRIQEIGRRENVDDFVLVDVNSIIGDVVEMTQPRWRDHAVATGRSITVDVALPTLGAPLQVAGNPHELREVLINLVHNAVDALPAGGRIVLSARRDGNTGEICVADTGTGMPESVRQRIFDPYFSTKGKAGTGLGLSVSQSIIRRHHGDIDVESHTEGPERGTRFIIRLPVYALSPADASPEVVAAPRSKHARVLVVDDEQNIREILSEILLTGSHEVVTAADGAEALHHLSTTDGFDLVFTDLGLPGMSGYEVASAIKKVRPHLPVGLVTGWGATLDAEKARAHGVDLVISKPFRFEQVLSLVQDVLEGRTGEKQKRVPPPDSE